MSRTYRSITYSYCWASDTKHFAVESELYGYANIKGAYWNWKKNSVSRFVIVEKLGHPASEPEEPFNIRRNRCKLKGANLRLFRKRDKKPWHKPKKFFKKMREDEFRAKCKHEIRTGRMNFPPYKKSDIWRWI